MCNCILNFIVEQSGKTTYIKQVALLQVMAQIGCYVPAQYASFRLCDSIFARIGSEDNMEANASTLMEELKDIHFMLSTSSDKSLVLIDELGKGKYASRFRIITSKPYLPSDLMQELVLRKELASVMQLVRNCFKKR